ncbi:hypothetical protein KQX54_000664 [Cotesia glomerata]|uniref:Uncharacterized protein n=1 Tax=Cotesia glomerata TaxID=32391 RepID=A0AAV7INR1_COTGL|nr:hypothetical protein KQX54_000664 [Cotesia glomerata]
MLEVKVTDKLLEGEDHDSHYQNVDTNFSPLMSTAFGNLKLSTVRHKNRFHRKFKTDGITKKTTKPKNLLSNSSKKKTIAVKVWETFGAVKRIRGSCGDVINTTDELIVHVDRIPTSVRRLSIDDNYGETTDTFDINNSLYDQLESYNFNNNWKGEHRGGGASGNTRGSVERGRISGYGDHLDSMDDPSSREDISEMVQQNISSKPKTSNINRSESYKERIHHKRQLREKRKTSDPNLSKTK